MPLPIFSNKKRGLLVITVILLLIFGLTVAYAICGARLQSTQAQNSLEQQLRLSNTYLSNTLEKETAMLKNVAGRFFLLNENGEEEAAALLTEKYAEDRAFTAVAQLNKNGSVTLAGGLRYALPDETGYARAFQGETVITEPFEKPEGGKAVAFLIPAEKNGETVGVLYAEKSVEQLQQELLAGFAQNAGSCAIVSAKGKVLFTSDTALGSTGENLSASLTGGREMPWDEANAILADLGERKTVTRVVQTAAGKQVVSYAPLEEKLEWSLFSIQDAPALTGGGDAFFYLTLGLLGLMLLLDAGLLVFYTRSEKGRRDEIERISTIDPLTGISNLTKFYLLAGRILNSEKDPYTLLRLDIRNFKLVNDGFGYTTGDQILKMVAQKMAQCYHTDEACARITMDQFVILAKTRDGLAEQCRRDLKQCVYDGVSQSVAQMVDFCIGSYDLIDNDESVVAAIDKCTVALKAAKATGVPGAIMRYNDSLVTHIVEEKKLEQAMHGALKNGEFQVYIQPKYRVSNGAFIGGEALVRWVSPKFGFLPPDRFIPLFERNGFIEEVDLFVLETVMQRLCYLQSQGMQLFPISVNMSRVTISTAQYLDKLRDLLEKYPLPGGMVELEVTESIFVGEYQLLLHLLERMRKMGCVIVMDDFGSGYSSLNLLKEVPFDILKIDREFLDEGETSQRTRAIMKSIIEMAKNINVQVVCEGVETAEQVEFLKELHCDVAQGYFFARPMPLPQFESQLTDGTLETNTTEIR
ncbi:MAG: EAL domain-containing protein [Oscillospiraceae bacterium]|nr:EAL domain-containing protein [Oscillospiraceae bacterium]